MTDATTTRPTTTRPTTVRPTTSTPDSFFDAPIDAVLFDLSGTTLDEAYARTGVDALAQAIHHRWGIDPAASASSFMTWMRIATRPLSTQPYHRMTDAVAAALTGLLADAGQAATTDELADLEATMWAAAIDAAQPAPDALETIARLRMAGVLTGIVSYADTAVFRALLQHSGLAGAAEIELCSEQAQSCKPDARVFLLALAELRVPPCRALFVGDSIDADIVGANRVGMRSALLAGRTFAIDSTDAHDETDRRPTYVIGSLSAVAELLGIPVGAPT
jgi:HAD superfamily hydrolase (TIGR01509 family)